MKLHDGDGNKVFINMCHLASVGKAEAKLVDGGQSWSVPHNLGPPRMEKDKSGAAALTFDFAVHSDALALAASSKPFKDMLCKVPRAFVARACTRAAWGWWGQITCSRPSPRLPPPPPPPSPPPRPPPPHTHTCAQLPLACPRAPRPHACNAAQVAPSRQ